MKFSQYYNRYGKVLVMHTPLISAFGKMRTLLETIGIDLEMYCGWRGEADQNAALLLGTSKAKFGSSPHNYGLAFDCAPVEKGKLNWEVDEATWLKIGMAGEKYGLQWGNDWDGDGVPTAQDKDEVNSKGAKLIQDRPHFQIKGWQGMGFELQKTSPPIG